MENIIVKDLENCDRRPEYLPDQVDGFVKEVKDDEEPPIEDLWNNIYIDGLKAKLQPIERSLPKIQL